MDTECKIPSSRLENVPIIDAQCCVNLTSTKPASENSKRATSENSSTLKSFHLIRYRKLVCLERFLLVVSILCLAGFMIYLAIQSGYFEKSADIYTLDHHEPAVIYKTTAEDQPSKDPSLQNLFQYFYSGHLRSVDPELRSTILRIDRNRLKKRHAGDVPCKQDMEHCKTVIDSMWNIVSIVNNSLPHLQALVRNFSTDGNAPKSKFVELVECLQCKNDSIAFIDESGPGNIEHNHRMTYQHSDHAQIKNNVDIVSNLLDEGQNDAKETSNDFSDVHASSNANFAEHTTLRSAATEENTSGSNVAKLSALDDERKPAANTEKWNVDAKEVEASTRKSNVDNNFTTLTPGGAKNVETSTWKWNLNAAITDAANLIEVDESAQAQTKNKVVDSTASVFDATDSELNRRGDAKSGITATTKQAEVRSSTISASTDSELRRTPLDAIMNATTSALITGKTEETTSRMDDEERAVVKENVTDKSDGENVTEMANDIAVHPSVQPSGQGHGQNGLAEREGGNASREAAKADYRGLHGRIVTKGILDSTAASIPTAETIKSTQQLQLTPTMSWMPYPVCFYGQAPSNAVKSAPGPIMYPASSPGASYPVSMPQQRQQGYQNTNQSPSYVQVQAQSVQFLPGQSFPNFGQGAARMGPTGPGMQNFPIFPGHQMIPSGAGNNGKSPYYCTYIPAPTFQFPAIPGVSEYQRSAGRSVDETNVLGERVDEKNMVDNEVLDAKQNQTNDDRSAFYGGYPNACPSNTIRCADGSRCISRTQRCDGQVDCNDASDETTCSCRDRVAQERLCDGYFDCPHGEDELGCLGCPRTSFSCNDWQRRYSPDNCVPLSQRCDGVKQCSNGKDEMDCNILTSSYIEGINVFTIGYSEGYLHKNFKGQWYPVCTAIESWAKDACASEIGSETNELPEIKIHWVPDKAYKGPYLAEVNHRIKAIPSCMNTAVYVRCPRLRCGTRILSQWNTIRPHVLEKEGLAESLPSIDEIIWPIFDDKLDTRFRNDEKNSSEAEDIVGSQLRVVGGRASQPTAWPFLVAIYKDGQFYCGGIILSEFWVLTAAHCLEGFMGHYFEIQAGVLRRFSFSPMAQTRKARYTVNHPRYSSLEMKNDIGMIMLDEPLRFNRWVRPICLPGPNLLGPMWRLKPEPNSTCIAIGWGATRERGPDPDHLREVVVPILPKCKHEIDQTEAAICAGYPEGGRDACQGDSGGPLVCRNPDSPSQWYVAGVISHGEGCARPEEPGTYTRVSYFLNWIKEVSDGGGAPPLKRTPLEKCPGFSCEGGLGKCLPIEARCNRIVDCLDGEDEVNCRGQYPLYRESGNLDPEDDVYPQFLETDDGTTTSGATASETPSTDSTLIDNSIDDTTDKPPSVIMRKNNLDFGDEDNGTIATTSSHADATSTTSNNMENILPTTPPTFPTIFTCTRLLQSIPIEKRCNEEVDCEDGTDEMNCTCGELLLQFKPTAICDGNVDCDDQTDEQDCEICTADKFRCKISKTCLPMSKKCDGNFDCEFKEDELDCFALTDGQSLHLDAEGRPFLNTQGVLSRYSNGKWQPTCHRPRIHRNQSTAVLIGQNMCEYFGFLGSQSSDSIPVKNSKLKMVEWYKGEPTYQEYSSAASLNDLDETCLGIYIRCTPALASSVATHLVANTVTGSQSYLWPWIAAIFVDGSYRCSALLLDHSWLLSTEKCLQDIRLDENYTTAVLGFGPLFRLVNGPHQQVSVVDEMHHVNDSMAVLLHLKDRIHFSRYVRPLFLDKTIYLPGVNDTCVAVATSEDYETKSIFLRPILQNCPSCQRCFVNVSRSECSGTETSNWSGAIFCRGKKGWYPSATFQDNKGACNFKNLQAMTSIDHINPYLVEAADAARQPMEATCYGYRCKIGQCIPQNRVCDGIPDCRDQEDEDPNYCERFRENCVNSVEGCSCAKTELRCRDGKCVDKNAFCDGNVDCSDGSDEPTICTCAEYLKLTSPERLCDGVRHCLDKTDESPIMCPCRDTSFKCRTTSSNDTCIPQDFICDGTNDCSNGEDEATCRMLRQSSPDKGVASGEVIHRSCGVWHTECFADPLSSDEDASELCISMGYSSGTMSNDTVITDEAVIPKRDDFYLVKINDWTWMSLRDDKPLMTLERSNETCHRAFVNCA